MTYRQLGAVLDAPADTVRGWEVHGYAPRKKALDKIEAFLKTVEHLCAKSL